MMLVQKGLDALEVQMLKVIPKEPREVYEVLFPYIKNGGKRIRPTFALLSCLCFGGDVKKVLIPGAIIELFHNFTLIHDDIEDNSLLRRGFPTLHKSHGIPIALNSGDALYTVLLDALVSLDIPHQLLITIQKKYIKTFKRVVEGQGIELNWYREKRFDIKEEEYYEMIRGKTSSLIGLSCEIGACMAGQDEKVQQNMKHFGEFLGNAFQIQDDILNITGDVEKYKKEIGGDITEGKRTLMVVHALSHASPDDAAFLRTCLENNETKKAKIRKCIDILTSAGSISHAQEKAREFVAHAKSYLSDLPESPYKTELKNVSDFIISREH